MSKYQIIYILGSGHSGSTLLDILLGTHPMVWSCGELQTFHRYLTSDKLTCACGEKVYNCSFWSEVMDCLYKKGVDPLKLNLNCPSWRKILLLSPSERGAFAKNYGRINQLLFDCIASVSKKFFIVDSSKETQRLYFMQRSGMVDLKVIHLVRDGRAVLNSFIRKYGKTCRWKAIYRWVSPNLVGLWLQRRFGPRKWLRIYYEQLATDPEGTLKKICRFLGIPYDPLMLRFKDRITHNIGGNSRVLYSSNTKIELDERWRSELGAKERLAFEVAVGWINKVLYH